MRATLWVTICSPETIKTQGYFESPEINEINEQLSRKLFPLIQVSLAIFFPVSTASI